MPDATVQQSNQAAQYLHQRLGQQISDGECYTSVHTAVTSAGLKSAPDFGTITPNADYVWGRAITANQVRAGDVIQFRNYTVTITTVTSIDNPDGSGSTETETETHERPHHTALIRTVAAQNGPTTVYESNVNGSRNVQSNELHLSSVAEQTTVSGQPGQTRTTVKRTITVTGTLHFYRLQAP